jgi:hypothetical protein
VKRREFIKLIGGATAAWPFGAHAQQAGRLPTIAWLGNYASTQPAAGWKAAFMEKLQDLGRAVLAVDRDRHPGRQPRRLIAIRPDAEARTNRRIASAKETTIDGVSFDKAPCILQEALLNLV